jgi:hypothetical protein
MTQLLFVKNCGHYSWMHKRRPREFLGNSWRIPRRNWRRVNIISDDSIVECRLVVHEEATIKVES